MKYPKLSEFEKWCESADKEAPEDRNQLKLMQFLQKMPVVNTKMRGNMGTRKTAITSFDWDIVPFDKADIENAKEAKRRLKRAIRVILKNYTDAVFYGTFLLKLRWELLEGWQVPIPETIFKPTEIENWDRLTVALVDKENKKTQITLDNTDYVQFNDGEIYRGGLLRSIAPLEILANSNVQEWAYYNKKLKGMIQGIEKGADAEEREVAMNALKSLLEENIMLTSDIFDFKFHNTTSSGASTSFERFIEMAKTAITIAILGQANTTELPRSAGSRAALVVQQMISADLMFSDVQNITDMINEQLIRHYFVLNKGIAAGDAPYEFQVILEEQTDYESNAVVVSTALSSGIPLKKDETYRKIGFTPPVEGDELIATNSLE